MTSDDNKRSVPGCIALVPIFSGLSPEEMTEIAGITQEKAYAKGAALYFAGEASQRLFVVHTGHVKISRSSPTGKTQVMRMLGPGAFLGELTIFNDSPLMDRAEASEPCAICVIEGAKLKELMTRFPSIAYKIMKELSSRLEKAENLIEDINLHSAEHRVAQALLELSVDSTVFELAMNKGDWASQLGMTQETLSRKLSLFQERGMIKLIGQKGIEVLDQAGLSAIRVQDY